MGEFEEVKPYTQAELDQQAIWADEFDQWWESEGQYHRAGGNEYCRTFAWWAWLNREQSKQSKIEQLEKKLNNCENLLTKWKSQGMKGCSDYARGGLHTRQDCEDALEKALRGEDE